MSKKNIDDCPPPDLPMKKARKKESYEERKKKAAQKRRMETRAGQDIGEIPAVKNPERREKCSKDLGLFCKTYFSKLFYLPWSRNHIKVIKKLERVIFFNAKFAVAMPRGKGKTSLCKAGSLLASLYGHHPFVVPIGATGPDGQDMIKWFKDELSTNELLIEDFPEVCYPIMLLENESRRCVGQRYKGKKTNITWAKDRIIFPTIPGSVSSGFIIRATSLEGHIRGMTHRLPDGRTVRPTLAIPDDPQTRESSRSQGPNGQTTMRLKIINEDVQGLAGPKAKTAILIPCTVITPGDLADQVLDRDKYPAYRGERTSRIYKWPTNKILWEEYRELYENALKNDLQLDEASDFYRERMKKCDGRLDEKRNCDKCEYSKNCMDCGAIIDWIHRLDDPENLSALQAAMHAFYEYGPSGFAAEFQNIPLTSDAGERRLTLALCQGKVNGRPRYEVPLECIDLELGIDVQQSSLWYGISAFKSDFTGYGIDYGVWPVQKRKTYTLSDIADGPYSLQTMYPGLGVEATIQKGLEDFIKKMLAINFTRSGNAGLIRITGVMVDSGKWPSAIAAVKHKIGPIMRLSKGIGIKAGNRPMSSFKRKKGERFDPYGHWYMPSTKGTREFPYVAIDVNYWKGFIEDAFLTAEGDPGSFSMFGDDPEMHSVFAAHQLAETWTLTHGHGRDVREYKLNPGRPDNHWKDSFVLCFVNASINGITVPGKTEPPRTGIVRRRRVPVEQLMAKRNGNLNG